MTTYCVWFDNFLQELFAIEKYEFDQYEKLQECLKNEKNTIYAAVVYSFIIYGVQSRT